MSRAHAGRASSAALALVLLAALAGAGEAALAGLDAASILQRALVRAERIAEQQPEREFGYELLSSADKLDAAGGVEEHREARYRLVLLDGHPFLRLVENDGKPPGDDDLVREKKREQAFLQRMRETPAGAEPEPDQDAIRFDADLVARYDAELLEVRPYADRHAFVLEYAPRPGPLPERRRIDKALNASAGLIWIDTETYEVARLEFELQRPVRFWWFLGVITHMTGYYERIPVEDVWLPSRGSLALRGRALLRSIREDYAAAWSNWARLDELAAGGRLPRPEDGPPRP